VAKIGKTAGTLHEGLHDFIICLLMKKNYVLCEVPSEVEGTVQDFTTAEAGLVPCVVRAESENIIDNVNITTSMLYSLPRAHCCQDTKKHQEHINGEKPHEISYPSGIFVT
jgi:hypothetical protein